MHFVAARPEERPWEKTGLEDLFLPVSITIGCRKQQLIMVIGRVKKHDVKRSWFVRKR